MLQSSPSNPILHLHRPLGARHSPLPLQSATEMG